ncbi:hypothetical protein DEO72_LG11g2897 [Vigna unguiculata]|uniref:PUM-HD domain-containing protein n=1 Tax=Vigna unguiculata TaxID=3917 RepID=A0A4D6NUD9_VIGUN|nr:hypothetical protein DEO72_LG11g2897 [Vigna unguiculata]
MDAHISLKMSEDNKRTAAAEEGGETRFVGIPNAPNPTPLPLPCLRVLHPDHVAVGSPITRVPPYSAPPPSPKFWVDHDSSLISDFSKMNLLDQTQTDVDPCPYFNQTGTLPNPYESCFNETGNLPYHHHVENARLFSEQGTLPYHVNNAGLFNGTENLPYHHHVNNAGLFTETGTLLPYHHHVNNAGLFDKGHTFDTPDDHVNHVYHHPVEQRRNQLQATSSGNYPTFRDRYMAPHSSGGFNSHVRLSPIAAMNCNVNNPSHYYVAAAKEIKTEPPHFLPPRRVGGDPAAFRCDNSIILQGRDSRYCFENGYGSSYRRGPPRDEFCVSGGVSKNFLPGGPSGQNAGEFSLPMPLDYYSVPDSQRYIYNLAKDQNGCRFLQRKVDEGSFEDMCIVFEGIIGSVVELMVDSFGNYLVQKLLDVCTDHQRLQIVLMLTNRPGQLVRISLNTHGTRVVQKLIETLDSDDQISLVKSAIQPGFLDLIKDLNGNHVIQRCLQCFSSQDNQFIFDASVKFCVEIATHQHGCCVLQRCIYYSMGKNRDRLISEICKHGLLLAQDPFGNYVVQYIIETDTPTAVAKMLGQFKGNYVHLSTQKFSSHVVEKCLRNVGDTRSRIVRELLAAPNFERLLQDPYANYVIQSALTFTKGLLHASLVDAIRNYKMLRSSPFCKRIFSGNLLRK